MQSSQGVAARRRSRWQRSTSGWPSPGSRRTRPSIIGILLLCAGLLLATWRVDVDFITQHQPIGALRTQVSHAPNGTVLHASLTIRRLPLTTTLPKVLPVAGPPTLDPSLVNRILAAYHSPLGGDGAQIVALSIRYGVDDAVALGFFVMESRIGTQGEAVATRSIGNLRPMPNGASLDGYRSYATWMDGVEEWFKVIHSLYLNSLQLTTVEAIVPVYAPSSDNNDPLTMIAGIRQLVACWRGQVGSCPADPPTVPALVNQAWASTVTLPLQPVTQSRIDGPVLHAGGH